MMSVADALALAVALALVGTLVSGVGWLLARARPDEDAHYVTLARLEDAMTRQQQRHDAAMLAMDRRLAAAVAIAIARGADIVRVHDVQAMVRVARVTDAIVRPRRSVPAA